MRNLKRRTRKPVRRPMSEERRDALILSILNAGGSASAERMVAMADIISANPTK